MSLERPRQEGHPWRTYLLASAPGWIAAGILVVLLNWLGVLPAWAALCVVAVSVAIDLAMFPRLRRYYSSDPADQRIVGEWGVAVSDVQPRGFVRVRGELWQARARADSTIRNGDGVRVEEIRGLELVVERHVKRHA